MIKWKFIPSFNDYYEISNTGIVRSVDRKIKRKDGKFNTYKSKIMSTHKDKDGYDIVELNVNGTPKKMKIHRLVCMTFNPISNPEDFQVDHIDENKSNNNEENLQWINSNDHNVKSKAGTFTFTNPEGEVVEVYNLRSFCRKNNLLNTCMSKVHLGQQGHHKGWKKMIKEIK